MLESEPEWYSGNQIGRCTLEAPDRKPPGFSPVTTFTEGVVREASHHGGDRQVHLKYIMNKLGANDRTQSVAIAARRGIIQL